MPLQLCTCHRSVLVNASTAQAAGPAFSQMHKLTRQPLRCNECVLQWMRSRLAYSMITAASWTSRGNIPDGGYCQQQEHQLPWTRCAWLAVQIVTIQRNPRLCFDLVCVGVLWGILVLQPAVRV